MKRYTWRLYVDENTDRAVVTDLWEAGFDVVWVAESPDLQKHTDDAVHVARASIRPWSGWEGCWLPLSRDDLARRAMRGE